MERKASAVWQGGLKDGKGEFSTTSGVFSHVPYSFKTRFEGAPGTNPEELIAAAHASCFSMALSAQLGAANLTPESINTTANLTLEKLDSGFAITKIHLDVTAKIPGRERCCVSEGGGGCEGGMPGVESAERADHDERQAGRLGPASVEVRAAQVVSALRALEFAFLLDEITGTVWGRSGKGRAAGCRFCWMPRHDRLRRSGSIIPQTITRQGRDLRKRDISRGAELCNHRGELALLDFACSAFRIPAVKEYPIEMAKREGFTLLNSTLLWMM